MKVTDKRMFTDDGELREEYRFLEQQKAAAAPTPDPGGGSPPDGPVVVEPGPRAAGPSPGRSAPDSSTAAYESSPAGAGLPAPGFMDLVAMIADPIAFLLGDAQLPDGQSAQDLPRARLQIDLLAVLQEKTQGNVTAEESAVLENLLAQLRMRYVEKSRN